MMGCIHPKSNLRQEGEGPLVSSEVGTGTQEPWYQPIVKGRYQFHIFSLSHPLVPVCPVTQRRRVLSQKKQLQLPAVDIPRETQWECGNQLQDGGSEGMVSNTLLNPLIRFPNLTVCTSLSLKFTGMYSVAICLLSFPQLLG